ncbi:hypothetical protein HY745_00245 [Candidatus Desantisbacteria bacterium]|nr:hypothetical protein [Candidatus Desantisbacteria bacterium]
MKKYGILFLMFFLVSFIFAEEKVVENTAENEEGKKLFETKCNQCHPLSRPLSKTDDLEGWKYTTKRMAQKTLGEITNAEAVKIAEYLASRNTGNTEKKDESKKEATSSSGKDENKQTEVKK